MSKNKFKLKHVALGLALVGYMSATALALEATTQNSIQGRAPVIQSAGGVAEKVTVNFFRKDSNGDLQPLGATEKLGVGDVIEFSYILSDDDGDKQGASGTASTIQIWYHDGSTWAQDTGAAVTGDPNGAAGTPLKATYTVSNALTGAKTIGVVMQEKTTYGAPSVNRWLSIADLTSANGPGLTPGKPGDPGTGTGPGDVGNIGGGIGGGGITPPTDAVEHGIFLLGDIGAGKDLSQSQSAITPILGSTYTAHVWKKGQTPGTAGSDMTSHYTQFAWSVVDGGADSTGAGNTALTGDLLLNVSTPTINLGDNSTFATVAGFPSTNNAGIQGYKLKVTINP